MKKHYDNGELITKDRIEDEDWYYDNYQPFMESCMGVRADTRTVQEFAEKVIEISVENYRLKSKDDPRAKKYYDWAPLHHKRSLELIEEFSKDPHPDAQAYLKTMI